jgi:8-oxo-dGTP diphosphatase
MIIRVKWVDLELADELMPYHPDGISKLIRKTGAKYTLQK